MTRTTLLVGAAAVLCLVIAGCLRVAARPGGDDWGRPVAGGSAGVAEGARAGAGGAGVTHAAPASPALARAEPLLIEPRKPDESAAEYRTRVEREAKDLAAARIAQVEAERATAEALADARAASAESQRDKARRKLDNAASVMGWIGGVCAVVSLGLLVLSFLPWGKLVPSGAAAACFAGAVMGWVVQYALLVYGVAFSEACFWLAIVVGIVMALITGWPLILALKRRAAAAALDQGERDGAQKLAEIVAHGRAVDPVLDARFNAGPAATLMRTLLERGAPEIAGAVKGVKQLGEHRAIAAVETAERMQRRAEQAERFKAREAAAVPVNREPAATPAPPRPGA